MVACTVSQDSDMVGLYIHIQSYICSQEYIVLKLVKRLAYLAQKNRNTLHI